MPLDGAIRQAEIFPGVSRDAHRVPPMARPSTPSIKATGQNRPRLMRPTMQRIASIATGNHPFGLGCRPMANASTTTDTRPFRVHNHSCANPKNPLGTGLRFPPFAYPSRPRARVREGKNRGPRNEKTRPRQSRSGPTMCVLASTPYSTAKLRLGALISEIAASQTVGRCPTGVGCRQRRRLRLARARGYSVAEISADGIRFLPKRTIPFTEARSRRLGAAPCAA